MLVRHDDRQLLHHQLFPLDARNHVAEDGKVRNPRERAGQTDGRHHVPLHVRYCVREGRVRRRGQECDDEEETAGDADGMIRTVWVGTGLHLRVNDCSGRAAPGPKATHLHPGLTVTPIEVEEAGGDEEADEDDGDVRVKRE